MQLSDTVHHVNKRIACNTCGARVFTYASTDAGEHYCTTCANRLRGLTLCQYCQRPLRSIAGLKWTHRDNKERNHPAVPEREWKYGSGPLQEPQPLPARAVRAL